MGERAISEWMRRYATAGGMRPTPGVKSMMYLLGIVPPTTPEDRKCAHTAAVNEVNDYSIQQKAAIPGPLGLYTQRLANRKLTERLHEKAAIQRHRAHER